MTNVSTPRHTEDLEDDLRTPVRPSERLLARLELEAHHTLLQRDDHQEQREARQSGGTELLETTRRG